MDQINRTTFAALYQVDSRLPDTEFERQVSEKQNKVLSDNMRTLADNMKYLYRRQDEMLHRLPVSNLVV